MADYIYFFSKKTDTLYATYLVESQYNMSLTIDGTKDSCKVVLYTYDDVTFEPNTIARLNNYWWIVKKDRALRYESENGFLYQHEVQLVGLVELLNSRDLTDCGFNQNTYTVGEFIARLITLSNLKQDYYLPQTDNIDLDQKVYYVKTYENYTLLSALRDFLDGYNCSLKLEAITNNDTPEEIVSLKFNIVPKTGDVSLPIIDIDEFTSIEENKQIDNNSFGTRVISNAENVISTEHKRFPSVGGTKLSANAFKLTGENALLRLPSKVFKANWLKIFYRMTIAFGKVGQAGSGSWYGFKDNLYVDEGKDTIVDFLTALINTGTYLTAEERQEALDLLHENEDYYVDRVMKLGTITLYEGNKIYNNGDLSDPKVLIKKGANVPYIPNFYKTLDLTHTPRQLILVDKDTREMLSTKAQGIYWERGSDVIRGFDGWDDDWNYIDNADSTDLNENIQNLYQFMNIGQALFGISFQQIYLRQAHFACDYIPMSDIKVSVDNKTEGEDIKLYNQNGKLTDSVAFSKLVNSYSKEIASDTITRYKSFYKITDVYKVGQRVDNNGSTYVINNISLDFTESEETGNFISGEFTMAKEFSVKSVLTNPNTNIREYGIPQTFNVKRKQVYKDYYEIAANTDTNADTDYIMQPTVVLNMTTENRYGDSHVAIIQCYYAGLVDGSRYWYYQLEGTRFTMEKMVYELFDFKDNNIIGYSPFSTNLPFDISKIFVQDGLMAQYNTPVSYVDSKGRVERINTYLVNQEQLIEAWDYYADDHGEAPNQSISLYNYSVFIDGDVYAYIDNNAVSHDAYIEFYDKDALEVPVLEYCCQIDDSDSVIVGDRIFMEYDNCFYLYAYAQENKEVVNKINALSFIDDSNLTVMGTYKVGLADAVTPLLTSNGILTFRAYSSVSYDSYSSEYEENTEVNLIRGRSTIIVRYAISKDISLPWADRIVAKDLVLIVKDTFSIDNKVILHLNHYKV